MPIGSNYSQPPSPPPGVIPGYCKKGPGVNEQTLRAYLGTYLFIWIIGGQKYWMYPNRVDTTMLYGYLWDQGHWHSAAVPLMYIDSFY